MTAQVYAIGYAAFELIDRAFLRQQASNFIVGAMVLPIRPEPLQ